MWLDIARCMRTLDAHEPAPSELKALEDMENRRNGMSRILGNAVSEFQIDLQCVLPSIQMNSQQKWQFLRTLTWVKDSPAQ